ncbi:MAG: hypothetical protein CMN29_31145 [Sandaracinus sp.]|nr:hypothetical protein [Sandaracinus sp.]
MDLPRPFGPYTLLRRLAVGGMAEVYVAKTRGLGGFEKLVAIKVIHPRFSDDDHFVRMLVEEAKLSVLLTHVNIGQTFDLGCIDDTYFLVMEFIEGADAYKILKRAAERRVKIPLDLCAFMVSEVCAGLDYAHRKRDVQGEPLNIVHRDISPQNVLISFAGEVKIVDFGIAKAAMRSGQTEVGVIKGKYYYMSPEQAWADPVDQRSDVFSTGIVLHELLTGQMLYKEDNLPKLLDRVRKAEIDPPSKLRPDIPQELDAIVMRALAKYPADRYQTAHELGQALGQFLYKHLPTFTPARLAALMAQLFPKELEQATGSIRLPSGERVLSTMTTDGGGGQDTAQTTSSGSLDIMRPEEYRPDPKKSVIFELEQIGGEFADESTSREIPEPTLRGKRRPPSVSSVEDEEEPTVVQVGMPDVDAPGGTTPDDEWDDPTMAAKPSAQLAALLGGESEHEEDAPWEDSTLVDGSGDVLGRMREQLEKQVAKRRSSSPPDTGEGPAVAQSPKARPVPPPSPKARSVPPPSPKARSAPPGPPGPPPAPGPPRASWPPVASPPAQPIPDLSGGQWGDVTGTPSPSVKPLPQSVPAAFDASRPAVGTTQKLAAVQERRKRRWLPWIVASVLVVAALAGGFLVRSWLADEPPEARIDVRSRPSGARVAIDGRSLEGATPLEGIELAPGGSHELRVELEGYEPWTRTIEAVPGTVQQVAVLVPRRRDLVLATEPPGAQVWIDGVSHGEAPARLQSLAFGRALEVRARFEGGLEVSRSLTIDAELPERIVLTPPE